MFFKMIWAMRRASRGKGFGNEIADSMAISRSLFHTAIEEGGLGMHLIMLASLKDEGKSVLEAREIILPILANGIFSLEKRLGSLGAINEAKPIVSQLLQEIQSNTNDNQPNH